ncbi:MAG: glycosyltransferase family 25 protein [Proteobacteria bacterium]|nr:glycosyltransferase family 25 protein [Pseudomonadota bacterium]
MNARYPIYYINLDRVPERADFMNDQFSRLGLTAAVQRISAVDALTSSLKSNYDQTVKTSRWELLSSEVAIFESHRLIWKRIVKEKHPFAVIMEDDILLSKDFAKTVETILDTIVEFDVLKLDGCNLQSCLFGSILHLDGVSIRPVLRRIGSSAGYMVSLSGAKKLLDRSTAYCDVADDFIFEPRADCTVFQIDPAVGVQAMFLDDKCAVEMPDVISQSERTKNVSMRNKRNKGPVTYRLKKEWHRLCGKVFLKYFGNAFIIKQSGKIGPIPLAKDLGQYK